MIHGPYNMKLILISVTSNLHKAKTKENSLTNKCTHQPKFISFICLTLSSFTFCDEPVTNVKCCRLSK